MKVNKAQHLLVHQRATHPIVHYTVQFNVNEHIVYIYSVTRWLTTYKPGL